MNPFLVDNRNAIEPTKMEPCIRCLRPIRKSHIITEVTIFLDAVPNKKGSYYFETDDGLILEDYVGTVQAQKYRRHRCGFGL